MRDNINKHKQEKNSMGTFATDFGGYSSPSFASTHCLTLSSQSLGVA